MTRAPEKVGDQVDNVLQQADEGLETKDAVKDDKFAGLKKKAQQMRVQFADISMMELDKETAKLIPEQMCQRYGFICIGKREKKITLAMADPLDVFAIDDVKLRTGFDIETVLAAKEDIETQIRAVYGEDKSWIKDLTMYDDTKVETISDDEGKDEEVVIDQPVVVASNKIITDAIDRRASDIHVEPFENELLVRYRIDGVLHEVQSFPKSIQPALISRLKIMSNLDIAEKRLPQDGRIRMRTKTKDLDIRVSVLPSFQGESVVMRLLDRERMKVELETLGFDPTDLATWREVISHPHGIILVTGPTGSGKSTTLYATLNTINDPSRKILTVEDPVEYYLRGIIQVQTNKKAGLTFASALRSFLRQDPDVIMLGEIRDNETATIATEAALTGHLVLSTLHTNDAVGAITRLADMGVERFLISSTVIGIIAQRLVRKICQSCKEPLAPLPELLDIFKAHNINTDNLTLFKGKGCPKCGHTGYTGRMGIYELFKVSDAFRELIVKHASGGELQTQARKDGLTLLFEDGLRKVAAGSTTYEELCRVTTK